MKTEFTGKEPRQAVTVDRQIEHIHSINLFVSVNEPRHDNINKVTVRPAKTQISLGFHLIWSESLLCAQWVAKDPSFLPADSEDSNQTGRMPRLIWVFARGTLTLLVLSCRGSNVNTNPWSNGIVCTLRTE